MRWGFDKVKGQRFKTRFLIFPKCIKNEWRWLETAKWEECYREPNLLWKSIMWINE